MKYAVKRQYGKSHDYLHAWCDKWGTSCMLAPSKAMTFATLQEAEDAATLAQSVCKGADGKPAQGVVFTAVELTF